MIPLLLLATTSFLLPQEPLRLGVLAVDQPGSADLPFVRAAHLAVEACNKKGGVDGAKIELVIEAATTPADVSAAVARLQTAGVSAIVAPPDPSRAAAARKATLGKLPCVTFEPQQPTAIAKVFDALLEHTFCMEQVGFVRDASKQAREFGKMLAKDGLTAPASIVWELDISASSKTIQKQFEKERPQLLLIDAEPDAVAKFLSQELADNSVLVVLTPRAYGEPVRKLGRSLFVVSGQSPGTIAGSTPFRVDYERDFGTPGFGAAEAYDGVTALARAIDAADSRELAAVQSALAKTTIEGLRGQLTFDKGVDGFVPPLAVWSVADGDVQPYVPVVVPLPKPIDPTATTASPQTPQTKVGAYFGAWRTRKFAFEEGAQWVLCMWADDAGFATADDDLVQLGLSTKGKDPLVDHLVKEEIMARVISITGTKYGRNEDGTGIEGKSLRICFGAHLTVKEREKKKQRLWPARFGGDHPEAGGEAFGTYCRVYTFFIRRTIFQKNALVPAVTTADRKLLDGTYVFGTDFDT
ncbi:MAG: ABC transporter substrate-binding protein, partial [Planctomycetota bacterium]